MTRPSDSYDFQVLEMTGKLLDDFKGTSKNQYMWQTLGGVISLATHKYFALRATGYSAQVAFNGFGIEVEMIREYFKNFPDTAEQISKYLRNS